MAGDGKATLTLALDSWTDGQVAPSRHTIDVIAPKIPLRLEPVSPRLRKSLVHPNRGSSLTELSYAPDGKRLLAGDWPGGVVQVWDTATGKELVKITTDSDAGFRIAPDWKTLYAGRAERRKTERIEKEGKKLFRWNYSGDVRTWDLVTGRLIHTYRHDPPRGIRSVVLAPDGAHFLTSDVLSVEREGKPKMACTLWDVKTGSGRQLPEAFYGELAAFAPDGRTLAIPERTEDYSVTALQLRDVATDRRKVSIPISEREATLVHLAFSPDGKLLAGQLWEQNSRRHWLRFWDPATGRLLASHEGLKGALFRWMVFSPDSRRLAVTTWREGPGRLFLFDVSTRKLVQTVPLGTKVPGGRVVVREPAFSPDGKWVAVATQMLPDSIRGRAPNAQDLPQPHIHLVDVAAGEVRETLACPQGYTISVCFSPDGKTLAAGGPGKVLLFDLSSPPARISAGRREKGE